MLHTVACVTCFIQATSRRQQQQCSSCYYSLQLQTGACWAILFSHCWPTLFCTSALQPSSIIQLMCHKMYSICTTHTDGNNEFFSHFKSIMSRIKASKPSCRRISHFITLPLKRYNSSGSFSTRKEQQLIYVDGRTFLKANDLEITQNLQKIYLQSIALRFLDKRRISFQLGKHLKDRHRRIQRDSFFIVFWTNFQPNVQNIDSYVTNNVSCTILNLNATGASCWIWIKFEDIW